MTLIEKVLKMDSNANQQTESLIPEPVRKFFWDRHVDRALSKMAESIKPKQFRRIDVNFCGKTTIMMYVEKIQINRTVPNPVYLCMWCGSSIESDKCPTCYPNVIGHKMGWCYFVVEHFQGTDYAVVFTDIDNSGPDETCEEVGRKIEPSHYLGPHISRNLNLTAGFMGLKRKKC